MKKYLLIIFSVLCSFLNLSAETIIEYHVTYTPSSELVDAKSTIPIHQILTVGESKMLVTQMKDAKIDSKYIMYDMIKYTQTEYTWKYGTKAYASKIRIPENEVILIPDAGKEVLGKYCDKALVIQGNDTTVVYYTTQFRAAFCPIGKIPGLALEYTVVNKAGKTHYSVVKIMEDMEVPASVYDFSEYEIIDREADRENQQKYALKYRKDREKKRNKKIGSKSPKYRFKSIDGEKYDSESLKGKIVVVNFWFTRCTPCIKEMPSLNKLVAKYKDREDIVFLAFALEEKPLLRNFLTQHTFDYKIRASSKVVAGKFSTKAYPTNVIIGKDGLIKEYLEGYAIDIAEQLDQVIQKL